MIGTETLIRYQRECENTIKLKVECAKKGHDHIVNMTSIDNFALLEMVSELLNFRRKFGEFAGLED